MIYMVELRDDVEIPDRGLCMLVFRNMRAVSKHVGLEPETNEPLNR